MQLGYNWLIAQKTVSFNASFVKWQAMSSGCVHLDIYLPLYGFFFSGDLFLCGTYRKTGNFGEWKHWRIWRIRVKSPNLNLPK